VANETEKSFWGRAAQICCLRLGEILVAVADRSRHVDIFDRGLAAERREHRGHQVAEAARLAGADVEDARYRRRLQEPADDGDRIVHVDEIAPLLAVGDARPVRLEQPDRTARLGVVETLGHETHHLALVVFVRAEDVEELESRPLRRHFLFARGALNDGEVEQMLAPAIEVQRLEPLEGGERIVVGKAAAAIPIGRSR